MLSKLANSSSKQFACGICENKYTEQRGLKNHMKKIHGVDSDKDDFSCGVCNFTDKSLLSIKRHLNREHAVPMEVGSICPQDLTLFPDRRTFIDHMFQQHGQPLWEPNQGGSGRHQPLETALGSSAETYSIPATVGEVDVLQFFNDNRSSINELIESKTRYEPQKVQFCLEVSLEKPVVDQETEYITIYSNTNFVNVDVEGIDDDQFHDMVDKVISTIHQFASHGSGWRVNQIEALKVKFAKFSPIRGSSFIEIPKGLKKHKRFLLNITNDNDKCFEYCYVAAFHDFHKKPLTDDDSRLTARQREASSLYDCETNEKATTVLGTFNYPMSVKEITTFEVLHGVQINVFRYKGKELLPFRISKRDSRFKMDLLLLSQNSKNHYVLIKNLSALVTLIRNPEKKRLRNDRDFLCRNCFNMFNRESSFEKHQRSCLQNEPVEIKMPTEVNDRLKFKNKNARSYCPYVCYFDIESMLKPVSYAMNNPDKPTTNITEKHEASSYCLVVVEKNKPTHYFESLKRGPTAISDFVKLLEKLAKRFHKNKNRIPKYRGNVSLLEDSEICWICEESFCDEETKVLDHDHFSGEFLGWAHSKCNLLRRRVRFTPIFAHNLSNYDLHFVLKELSSCSERNLFSILPLNEEKYISLSMKVFIRSYTTKNGTIRHVYEEMRFLDSYKFMNSSLDKLAHNLPATNFKLLNNWFRNWPESTVQLVRQKGFFPYSYIDSFEKYEEKELPPRILWKNSLKGGEISVTEEEYAHARKVYKAFNHANLGEYSDCYLRCDTFILADVFENFREICYQTYSLDCAQYYTASNLSGDAFLRVCKADIQLLTNREHLDMAENLKRGGISSVFAKRLAIANNKFVENFDKNSKSTFLTLIDANNLYGGIMEKFPLPLNNFQFNETITIEEILSTDNNSNTGYIVEVDLDYPWKLHDQHADFPLAPTKEIVQEEWMSRVQLSMLAEKNIPTQSNTPKLLQTLFNKKNYTVHYITLKLYVKLGLTVSKLHRVLQFSQSKWMAPYIELNTLKRKRANNKFEEDFFKLLSNSAYGKCCESKRNRVKVRLVKTKKNFLNNVSNENFAGYNIIDEKLVTIATKVTKVVWDKPTIVGSSILDLAKYFMFNFHYNIMKENFKCQLLYSDTDSFLYEIESDNFYAELKSKANVLNEFDFSNYPKHSYLYNIDKIREVLKFKDEMGGKLIKEFCCLKPKLYSILLTALIQEFCCLSPQLYSIPTTADSVKKSAKGITKHAQEQISHDNFKECLLNGNVLRKLNTRIASSKHALNTVTTNKLCLSSFDNKRFIKENCIDTLPYGHCSLIINNDSPVFSSYNSWPSEARWLNQQSQDISSSFPEIDPGFNQPEYSTSDLEDNIVDFNNLSREEDTTPISYTNPFIEWEASESSTEESPRPKKRRRKLQFDSE